MDKVNVDLEGIGLAEATLQRLLQERKSLEDGVQVLGALRVAAAQLQEVRNELGVVKGEVVKEEDKLTAVKVAQVKLFNDIEVHRKAQLVKMEKELDAALKGKKGELFKLNDETAQVRSQMGKYAEEYRLRIKEYTTSITEQENKLAELKEQQDAVRTMLLKVQEQVRLS